MENKEIFFSSYDKNNQLLRNKATLTVSYNEYSQETRIFELSFLRPIYKISPAELFDLQNSVSDCIDSIVNENDKTIGDIHILPALSKKGGFDNILNNVKGGLANLDKKGKLTENDKKLAQATFDLIAKLTGKK